VLERRNDDQSQPRKCIAESASAFERNGCVFERTLHCLVETGARARTQRRVRRAQVRVCAEKCPSAFDRRVGVRPHFARQKFQELNRNQKQGTKNANLIFFWILSIQKHEINKIIAQLKITSRKIKLI
jgi:hypothetical protein